MNKAELKIKNAFEKAAEYHRKGSDPDDAISKAASEEELNPEMIRRVVEMFNIAKTNSTLKVAADKTASFPIARIDQILKKTFVDVPLGESKTAEVLTEKTGDFSVNFKPVEFFLSEKQAAPLDNLNEWVKQAQGILTEQNDILSNISLDGLYHQELANVALHDAVDYFSTSNNLGKFARFERDVISEYGPDIKTTLDVIYEEASLEEPRFTGTVKISSIHITPTEIHQIFDKLMDHSGKYLDTLKQKEAKVVEFKEQQNTLNSLILQTGGIEPEFPKEATAADLLDFEHAKKKAKLGAVMSSSTVDDFANVPLNAVQSSLTDKFTSAHSQAMEYQYKMPKDEVDMEMQNVKRKAIMQHLLSNDEILAKSDPGSVETAYNVLLHLAPDATLNHGVTQAFLRSAIANQAVDPFTAKQIAELQGQITKNKILAKGSIPLPGT